jgi:predicted dehydrogenase
MVKLGIMSFAHMHAYSYAASINALPNTELTAVWGYNVPRARKAAKQFNTRFVKDVNDFLDLDLDGVIICSENVRHKALVDMAASAGKWILCEKPLSPAVHECEEMIDICEKASVGLGTAFPCRHVTSIVDARNRIQAGEIGEVLAVSCTNHGQFPGGWFADEAWAGGGATMDHTVHVVDVLRWILGKEFINVYCELGNQFHGKHVDTDDLGSLNLEMEGGIRVSHIASWSRPENFPTWGDVTLEFIGTGGVMNVDAFNQKLDVYHVPQRQTEWAFWGDNPDMGLVADFADAIIDQRPPAATGVDGLRATQVTVGAYASAKRRRVVAV